MYDFAEDYTAAWCGQDPARVAAFFAENGSLTINGGEPALGREVITEAVRGYMTGFPDHVLLLDKLEESEGRILFHWTFEGTNTGPGGTGKRVRFSGYESWLIGDDGLIADSQGHYDAADYLRQLEGARVQAAD
jgi:nuclear transport factor 2 (NTF2) superfamily protein